MALQTGSNVAGWESMFIEVGISVASTKIYAQTLTSEKDSLHMLDPTMLKELGIKTIGDVLDILKLTKEPSVSPAIHVKAPPAKLPQLNSEITPQQFQKLRID